MKTEAEIAEGLANDLIECWTYGTDLKETLPDWAIEDLREKATSIILQAMGN